MRNEAFSWIDTLWSCLFLPFVFQSVSVCCPWSLLCLSGPGWILKSLEHQVRLTNYFHLKCPACHGMFLVSRPSMHGCLVWGSIPKLQVMWSHPGMQTLTLLTNKVGEKISWCKRVFWTDARLGQWKHANQEENVTFLHMRALTLDFFPVCSSSTVSRLFPVLKCSREFFQSSKRCDTGPN